MLGVDETSAKPIGVRKLVRMNNGTNKIVFVDPRTGAPIQDPSEYNIVSSGEVISLEDLNLEPTTPDAANKKQTTTDRVVEDNSGTTGGDNNPGRTEAPTNSKTTASVSSDTTADEQSTGRTAENGFGYKSKPGLVTAAQFAPGAIGLAGKAVGIGYNVNNVAAENAAREAWGMEPSGFLSRAKDAVFGSDGKVAGISLKDQDNVSFFSKMNDPNQDPNVASPSTSTMSAMSIAERSAPGQSRGMVGTASKSLESLAKGVSNFAESLFGGNTKSGGVGVGSDGFPDAPSPTGNEYSESFPDAPAAPEGLSPGAMGGIQKADVGPTVDTTGMSPGAMGGESQSSAASKSGGADAGAGLY